MIIQGYFIDCPTGLLLVLHMLYILFVFYDTNKIYSCRTID